MALYSAADLIGKTLYAATRVEAKKWPEDSAPVLFTIAPGKPIGVVDSYFTPKQGRSDVYFSFNVNNAFFYVAAKTGTLSESAIREQGVLSTKEQIEAEAKKQESTKDFIERIFKVGLIATGIIIIGKTFINASVRRKN